MHLVLAPLRACVVLVEAGEIAIVALVERLVLDDWHGFLTELFEHQIERALGAFERRGKRDVETQSLCFEFAPGVARFGDPLLGQIDIAPAGEQIFLVPLALAVAHEHKQALTHTVSVSGFFSVSD